MRRFAQSALDKHGHAVLPTAERLLRQENIIAAAASIVNSDLRNIQIFLQDAVYQGFDFRERPIR